jgi:hypothetical protein
MTNRTDRMHPCLPWSRFATAGFALAFAALTLAAAGTPAAAQGNTRELFCRGAAGLPLKVDLDPSPRDTANVVMALDYRRPNALPLSDLRQLQPGECSWNPYNFPGYPVEPGRVRFDVRRQGQPWSATGTRMMDTTVGAARFFPDPITLPRYLGDPNHYWKFYVDDATNLAYSYTSLFDDGLPTYVNITGPVQLANDVKRDLVCRGGTAGLLYGGGATVGSNLAKVQLTYRVSPNVPGAAGTGLATGSCAWTDRTAMPPEPGKIWFITASNAQLKQMQSGAVIDRSATAAERYPDVRSIPEYLEDPAHYWTFIVMSRDPDSALANGPWKRDLTSLVSGTRTTATSTTRTQPTSTTTSQPYTPGAGNVSSQAQLVFDIRNVSVTPGLDGVVIRFEAATDSKPTVDLVTIAGVAAPITVSGTPIGGGMSRYAAASQTKLPRNTYYKYVIAASATAQARANQKTGTFKTLMQSAVVAFTEIYLVSDGDASSPGELVFAATTCPTVGLRGWQLGKSISDPLSWDDGRHVIDEKMTPYRDTVPDRFRVVVVGIEDDRPDDAATHPSYFPGEHMYCVGNGPEPGRSDYWEWNSIVLEFDLAKYPGAKGGEQFYKRSKPLRGGSSLSFEVRGYIQVTRE